MTSFKIYGASDDLIEVEGQDAASKKIGDEFNVYDGPNVVVLHPTQDVFTVHYGDPGVWRVEHTTASGQLDVSIDRAPEGDDPDPYTDTANVSGSIERVEVWKSWPPSRAELSDALGRKLEDLDAREVRRWSDAKVAAVLAALGAS